MTEKMPALVSQLDQTFSLDSLPYHDALPLKDQKQAANKMIDDEVKKFPKVKNYLADFPLDSEQLLTPALKELLKMAETNTAIDAIDESRFGVPDLEQVDTKDPQGTLKSLELFEAQLMFMDLRKHHLQLAQKYASTSLRQTSSALKYASDEIGRKATELKKETFDIHRERKREQTQLGKQIKDLEETWNEESERVNNLMLAIATKKAEIQKIIENVEN